MSRSLGRRRQSNLKEISVVTEPPGTKLKFKWSISAAHLASLEDDTTIIFPSIPSNRSQRKYFPNASSKLTDQQSVSHSSVYTSKSSPLPRLAKQCQSPISTKQEKSSPRHSPLLLSYAQLQRLPPSSPIRRQKQEHLSIFPVVDDKRNSMSFVNREFSVKSGSSLSTRTPFCLSPSKICLSPSKTDRQLLNENFVRLHTPQLRNLNVSEKYLTEAKTLYFDVNCRSFIPRVSIAQIF